MATLNPLKAIRAKCIECSGGDRKNVKDCEIPTCPIYPFRMGKNPNRTTVCTTTEEQKETANARLKKAWENKKNKE